MITLRLKSRDGTVHEFSASEDATLMESIRNAGFDELQATCGGCASCATCHVYVESLPENAELPELSEIEDELLESSFFRERTSRLSCQLLLNPTLDGMTITVAPQD